jgi:hypothetical protein
MPLTWTALNNSLIFLIILVTRSISTGKSTLMKAIFSISGDPRGGEEIGSGTGEGSLTHVFQRYRVNPDLKNPSNISFTDTNGFQKSVTANYKITYVRDIISGRFDDRSGKNEWPNGIGEYVLKYRPGKSNMEIDTTHSNHANLPHIRKTRPLL